MPFVQHVHPQFRDADEDGLIGLRGSMRCFQDIHTWYMHAVHKGNDELPEQYGAAWVYTRYHIRLFRKMDYTDALELSAWMEPYRQPVLVNMDMQIRQHGVLTASGKLESCIYSLERRRPLRLSAVDFPENMPEEREETVPDFFGIPRTDEGMEVRYERTVRVSDLDKSRHMTNLRYIEMFQDAYDSAFWKEREAQEMEICFLSQCMEGERLTVKGKADGEGVHLAALHADGTLASVARFV